MENEYIWSGDFRFIHGGSENGDIGIRLLFFFFKEDQNNFNRIWTYSDKTIMTNIGRVPTDLVHIKKTYVPTASSYGEEI